MRHKLSLKKTWYGLLLLVALIPALLILVWGGTIYHQILLEKQLIEEDYFRELAVDHVQHEVLRLGTLLENKSDPMAYTLSHKKNTQLLDELIYKVTHRESTIRLLLIVDKDGQLITGLEVHNDVSIPLRQNSELSAHWQESEGELPDEVVQALQGKAYTSPVFIHQEGLFFILSVPIGSPEEPLAALIAYVDASILWQDVQLHLQRERVSRYLVDDSGSLLMTLANTRYRPGDSLLHLPVIKTFIDGQKWQADRVYQGIMGQPVFGNLSWVNDVGFGIVTEIEHEYVLQQIQQLLFKLALSAILIIILLLGLGMYTLRRVIKPIDFISSDFKRIAKQDYTPSTLSSSFVELQTLVEGFNHMVSKIAQNQQELQKAAVVFDNTSEGIFITDANHRIVNINPAFSKITGYSEDEVIGKKPSILSSGQHDNEFYASMMHSINETGQWNGEIWNRRKTGEIYTELLNINTFKDIYGELIYYIGVFTDISHIKEVEKKLEYQAHHDPLTSLPNRLLCHARMEHEMQVAKRNQLQVAILFLDLDMFKNINDSMGHTMGDILLQQVAKRISDSIRNEDTIARLGGDEFVIILGALKSREDASLIAENTLALFSTAFFIDDQEIFIGTSIGISLYPDDGEDPDILLRNSDSAMYKAKSLGRNNYQFYTTSLTKKACDRLKIETCLRQALEKNEFCVYYQPQYTLTDEKIIGVEALLRWNHPEMGMISPDKFIPIAEETGLIIPIGEWVLKTACQQLKEWMDAGYSSLKMAVNLSARQFWKPGLEKMVTKILNETGINPGDLDLELTESIIMHDTLIISDTLHELHQMGVELSIDDFGTGYSSLSYIQRFPLDRLKIDRSFVQDITSNPDDADMIIAIIALGHSMKLKVLAEGVETQEQLAYLKEQGCDEVQGFYFSRPIPPNELEILLDHSNS